SIRYTSLFYTLSLHDALPIFLRYNDDHNSNTVRRSGLLLKIKGPPSTTMRAYVSAVRPSGGHDHGANAKDPARPHGWLRPTWTRSEEHTSELQSRFDLVCRLL